MSSIGNLPLPVAHLVRRAQNAKAPKEGHDTAYSAWEASIRLAAISQPRADVSSFSRGTLGQWAALVPTRSEPLTSPALRAVYALFAEIGMGTKRRPAYLSARQLFDALVAYRNQVLGHGATRSERYYSQALEVLLDGLLAAWDAHLFLPPEVRLVFVDSVEIDSLGSRRARVIDLMGPAPSLVGLGAMVRVPDEVLPKRICLRHGSRYRSLYPWLLFREIDIQERVLFFNGTNERVKFLDYASGETVREGDLSATHPTLVQDISSVFRQPPSSARTTEPASDAADQNSGSWRAPEDDAGDLPELNPVPAAPPCDSGGVWRGRVALFAALMCTLLAVVYWPRQTSRVRPEEEDRVAAFSEDPYYIPVHEMKNGSIRVPLETNGRIDELWLESLGDGHRTQLAVPPLSGALMTPVAIDSVLLAGDRFDLHVRGSLDGEEFSVVKRLLVRRRPPEIEFELKDGCELPPVIKGTISEPEASRVLLGDSPVEIDAAGCFTIDMQAKPPKNCVSPVGNLQNVVLLNPITVQDLYGNIVRRFHHYVLNEDHPFLRIRTINDSPAAVGDAETGAVSVLAGQAVAVTYSLRISKAMNDIHVMLTSESAPERMVFADDFAGSPSGEYRFTMPREPGLYLLTLAAATGSDPSSGRATCRIRAEELAAQPAPSPVIFLDTSEERAFNGELWRQGRKPLGSCVPPLYVSVRRCRAPLLASAGGRSIEVFAHGDNVCLVFGTLQDAGFRQVLSLACGPWTLDVEVQWVKFATKECSVCRRGGRVDCPYCVDGKARGAQCDICGGRGNNSCQSCQGTGRQLVEPRDDLVEKCSLLEDALADARAAKDARDVAFRDRREAMEILDADGLRSLGLAGVEAESQAAEHVYWEGLGMLAVGHHQEAITKFEDATGRFRAFSRNVRETWGPEIQASIDAEKTKLAAEFDSLLRESQEEECRSLERMLPGATIDLQGTPPFAAAVAQLSTHHFGADGGIKPDVVDSLRRIAQELLKPDRPLEALATSLEIRPWPAPLVLTRESLRVLDRLRNRHRAFCPGSASGGQPSEGGVAATSCFGALALTFALWALRAFMRGRVLHAHATGTNL